MSHNEPVSWLQWSVDLILPELSVRLMSQRSGLLPPLNVFTSEESILIFTTTWIYVLDLCNKSFEPFRCFRCRTTTRPVSLCLFVRANVYLLLCKIAVYRGTGKDLHVGKLLSLSFCCFPEAHDAAQCKLSQPLFKWLPRFNINYNKCA